ncbi:MAG: hypothetical protein J0M28_16225 [Thauera sp.]|nr:hypothetical protein [Thauera sp.]
MTSQTAAEPVDFRLLDEASRKLLGYYVHRKFHNYLSSIVAALNQQYRDGMNEGLTQPTPLGRAMLLDFRALDYNALTDVVGVCLYVLLCHATANARLQHRDDAKRVLYLRGFDFEAAFTPGGGVAAGISTWDTTGFTLDLPALLQRPLFKILSPKEVDSETMTAERYYENLAKMNQWISQRPAAIYLNALHWQRGLLELIPRMDHFIVYVSSLTESALWELEQLRGARYRDRVTVIFDDQAIERKVSQLDVQQAMDGKAGSTIWSKQGPPPSLTAAQVRESLAEVFTVMSPDAFKANIEAIRRRIDDSHSELEPGEREIALDFEFYPSVDDSDLNRLREMSRALAKLVEAGQSGPIDSLSLFVAQIQLLIHVSLLLGDHDATGRALAAYAAVMWSASNHYEPTGDRADELPEENREQLLGMLDSNGGFAEYAGRHLLAYGRVHELSDETGQADATWNATFEATRKSVDKVFADRRGAAG